MASDDGSTAERLLDHNVEPWSSPEVIFKERDVASKRREAVGLPPDEEGIALALSGGGIRGAAFHVGVLWQLARQNVLRHVDVLSSVSGGGFTACAFLAEIVQVEKELHPTGVPPAEMDSFLRICVERLLLRMQRNCGYFVSWDKEDTIAANGWGGLKDGTLMVSVIIGIFVLNPIFLVLCSTTLLNLIDSGLGPYLRYLWCTGHTTWGYTQFQGFVAFFSGKFFGWNILVTLTALIAASLAKLCTPVGSTPWIALTRFVALCWRLVMLIVMLSVCVQLVWTTQSNVAGSFSVGENTTTNTSTWSLPYNLTCGYCTSPDGLQGRVLESDTSAALSSLGPLAAGNGMLGILVAGLFVGIALVGLLIAGFARASVLLMLLWPLLLGSGVAELFRWRLFGPLDGQQLFGYVPFTSDNERWVQVASACVLCILGPLVHELRRFVHLYYRARLRGAFFANGEDVRMSDLQKTDVAPYLITGAMLADVQRPLDEERFSTFSVTPYFLGCDRTGFMPTQGNFRLSKAMALSGAGIDGLILSKFNRSLSRFVFRFLLSTLNLGMGDWVLFRSAKARWNCPTWRGTGAHVFAGEVVGWCAFVGLILASSIVSKPSLCHQTAQSEFWWDRVLWTGFAVVFGISFLTFLPAGRSLLRLPTFRHLHQLLGVEFVMPDNVKGGPEFVYLCDGGLVEDLGLLDLLRRRYRRILSVDAGDDPDVTLADLRNCIKMATEEKLCSFYDIEDPRRDIEWLLESYSKSDVYTHPHLRLGVLYGWPAADGGTVRGTMRARAPPPGSPGPMEAPMSATSTLPGVADVGEILFLRMRKSIPGPDPHCIQPIVKQEELWRPDPPSTAPTQRNMQDMELGQDTPLAPSLSSLGACCCNCCHRIGCLGGGFPDLATGNQFFTPILFANYLRFGYVLSESAVQEVAASHV